MSEKIVEIKINTVVDDSEAVKSINDLKKAINDLQTESDNLDLGSEAFEKSKEQIDSLKTKLESLSKSQSKLEEDLGKKAEEASAKRAENMEKIGNNLQKFAAGVTDAFAGAFIAFGAGEEDAKKMNETLQMGVGIAVGVKGAIEAMTAGVQLAGPAFEVFNAIVAANPIMITVLALAALTAGIYFFVKSQDSAAEAQAKANERLRKTNELLEKQAKLFREASSRNDEMLQKNIELAQAQGKSAKEVYELEKIALRDKIRDTEVVLKTLGDKTSANYLKEKNKLEVQNKDLEILDAKYLTDKKEKEKKAGEDRTANKLKQAEIDKKIYEDEADAWWQAQLDEQAENKKIDEQTKKDDEKRRLDAIQSAKDMALALEIESKHSTESRLNNLKVNYDIEVLSSKDNYAKLTLLDAKYEEDKEKIIKEGEDAQKKIKDDAAKADEEAFKKKVDNVNKYTQAIGSALNAVVGVFSAINDLQKQEQEQASKERQERLDADLTKLNETKDAELAKEGLTADQKTAVNQKYAMIEYDMKLDEYNRSTEIKKKSFEQDKKLKIATTIINTITGAVAAFTGAMSLGFPAGPIIGAIMAAAVVATGAIQVSAIKKQKFDAGTPPSPPKLQVPSTGGMGDGGKPEAMEGPSLKKIGRTTEEVSNEASGKSKRTSSSEPVRAYVVTEDINASQNKQAVLERRSSF